MLLYYNFHLLRSRSSYVLCEGLHEKQKQLTIIVSQCVLFSNDPYFTHAWTISLYSNYKGKITADQSVFSPGTGIAN